MLSYPNILLIPSADEIVNLPSNHRLNKKAIVHILIDENFIGKFNTYKCVEIYDKLSVDAIRKLLPNVPTPKRKVKAYITNAQYYIKMMDKQKKKEVRDMSDPALQDWNFDMNVYMLLIMRKKLLMSVLMVQ